MGEVRRSGQAEQSDLAIRYPIVDPLYANQVYSDPLYANTVCADPLYANPLLADPFLASRMGMSYASPYVPPIPVVDPYVAAGAAMAGSYAAALPAMSVPVPNLSMPVYPRAYGRYGYGGYGQRGFGGLGLSGMGGLGWRRGWRRCA